MSVNKLTSHENVLPKDPYSTALCPPKTGFWDGYHKHQNLGQFLAGSRIESSPYELLVDTDEFCKQLCVSYLGYPNVPKDEWWIEHEEAMMQKPIEQGYHQHFIVDNLSAASISESEYSIVTRYWDDGVPLGFVGDDGLPYVYNLSLIHI